MGCIHSSIDDKGPEIGTSFENNVDPMVMIFRESQKAPSSWDRQIDAWVATDRHYSSMFRPLIESIAIVPELMGSSRMDKKLSMLHRKNIQNPQIPSFERTVSNLISKTYQTGSPRHFHGRDPGGLSNGNIYNGCIQMYNSLHGWQKPYFHRAIYELELNENDRDSLQVTCGLILRAAGECQSRKQDVFTKVIDRCIAFDTLSGGTTRRDHFAALFEAARIPIDEMKETAFKSVFLEPTKMYYRAVGDQIMEGDVEVHGSNTYLAILLATLGVKLPRIPLLDYGSNGVAAFADAFYEDQLTDLWNLDNKGKSWELVVGNGTYHFHPVVKKIVPRNRFHVNGNDARTIAKNCLKKTERHKIKPYLEAFVAHFTTSQVAERICNYFLYQDDLHGYLNTIFVEVAPANEVNEAGEDVRYWLWNVISGEFCLDRALCLLQYIGVFK